MASTFKVEFTCQIAANGLGSSREAESGGSRGQRGRILGLVALWFLSNVLLLGDEVVNALFELHY